jgi:lipid II:glycine glycyltransferase (peptidoglycan interpeptide bridge formation enzyme)
LIAANMYLICANTLYYKINTSSLEALHFRPNNLMFWEGIKFAKERGLEYVDLGSSGCEQEGLILFKNHTGAKIYDITHLGYAPPNYKFSQKRILRIMTKSFTLPFVPDFMIKMGSHWIYPYLA